MSSFTDLLATEGFVMRLIVPGAACAFGTALLAWRRLRLLGMTAVAVLVGMLSAHAAPPENPNSKALPSTPLDRYYRQVTSQVEKQWKAYRLQRGEDVRDGSLKVEFFVTKMGRVENVRAIDLDKSYPVLTGFTLRAVRDAELPPMPADVFPLLPMNDPERLRIEYSVFIVNGQPQAVIENGLPQAVKTADVPGGMPEMPPGKPIPKALPVADDVPVRRNQDPNAFTPFTRTPQPNGANSNPGRVAPMPADDTPLGRYYRLVTGQVEKKWNIYRVLRREGVTYGSLQVVFYVNKKGKVENLRVLDDKKSNKVLTAFTLQAIKDAEIPPMPADVIPLLPKNDPERLKIDYNVLIY